MRLAGDQQDSKQLHERLIAEAVMSVACELRLIDIDELVSFIRAESFANIQDLVNSSAELFFRPGTLTFAWAANAQVSWISPPSIVLDLEFHNRGVTVFFSLTLEGASAGVDIRHMTFDSAPADLQERTSALRWALSDAQLDGSRPPC